MQMKIGVTNEINLSLLDFYKQNYDVLRTPDFKDSTRLLKPEHPHNYKHPIDCVIKNFQADAKYTKAILSFSELQCMFNKNVESNSYEWAKMTLVQKK